MPNESDSKPVNPLYIIAALLDNHGGDIGLALDLAKLASEVGCNALAIQRGTPVSERNARLEMSELAQLREFCKDRLDFIAAPYDISSLDELQSLNPTAYQLEPEVLGHVPLIRQIAKLGKPVFLSLGACTETEVEKLIKLLDGVKINLLHCIHAQSVKLEQTALGYIPYLIKKYEHTVGYYGRERGISAPIAAIAMGARVIEKSFTTDHRLSGANHASSLDRDELRGMVTTLHSILESIAAQEERLPTAVEMVSDSVPRATLIASRNLHAGEVIELSMFDVSIGNSGVSPLLSERFIGKKLAYDLNVGTPLTLGMIQE